MMTLAERQALDRMRDAVERFASVLDEGQTRHYLDHASWAHHLETCVVRIDSQMGNLFRIAQGKRYPELAQP